MGSFQVLYNHAALLSSVEVGELKITDKNGTAICFATSGGFVDVRDNYLTVDLVRNDPFLRNKPVTLELGRLSLPRVEALCARYRIATFDKEQAERFGIEAWARTHDQYNARVQAARARMQELGCGAPVQAAR